MPHLFTRSRLFAAAIAAVLASGCSSRQSQPPLFVTAPGSPIAIEEMPGNIAIGDLYQDGNLDLVVVSGKGVNVLLGQGDGRFVAAPGSPVQPPQRPTEMALADFNGDGSLDMALASHDSYDVTLLLGNGTSGFAAAPPSPVTMKAGGHPHTHGLDAGDFNKDGALDIVTVNSDDNDVSIAFGDGKGGFTPAPASIAVGPSPYPGAVGDLNGDGNLDIVATSTGRHSSEEEASTNALTILWGDGQGGFQTRRIPLRTVLPWFAAIADLNADAKPDLALTHTERNELTILLGDGEGGFTEPAGSPIDLGHSAWRIAVADMNGDGKPDIAAPAGDDVRLLLGDGQGGFRPAPGSPFRAGKGTWQLALGDFNADGKPDIAATNLESNGVAILLAQ